MSLRKSRAWAAFWTGVLIVVLALIVEVLTMPKYNNYDLPELPTSEYKNAYIAVSGDTAYLYFVDKKGYIEVDPNGLGNTYTLGLTTTDPYDESKILFAEKYTATIGGDSWTAEELPDLSDVYDIPAYAQFALPCEIGGPVWSNVTLLDQNGDVFIEGTNPIDADKAASRRYSFTLGYLMAQCGPPLKLPDKQPTAYSYNGVVLPKLPEVYDAYPNKYILQTADGAYMLYESTSAKTVSIQDGKNGYMKPSNFLNTGHLCEVDGNAWVDGSFGKSGYVIWSNTDVYYKTDDALGELSGRLYLPASSPVSTADGASYNGIELPRLPTLAYPYKAIYVSGDVYYFVHSDSEMQYRDGGTFIGCIYDTPCQRFKLESDQWVYADDESWYATNLVWANHNIPNLVDGGVYRNADSDPIPVYE